MASNKLPKNGIIESLIDINTKLQRIQRSICCNSSGGGLTQVNYDNSGSVQFSGTGTVEDPLIANYSSTPVDTIYTANGTITSGVRSVSGNYGTGIKFGWTNQGGTPDAYLIGVNSGGGGGQARVIGEGGSLIINSTETRLASSGILSVQAFLKVTQTNFDFAFGSSPTIVNIQSGGLYLPTTPNVQFLATDSVGKLIPSTKAAHVDPTTGTTTQIINALIAAGLMA